MRGLGEMFNVNYFLASQANPWLVPVLAAQHKLPLSLQKLLEWELKHRAGQLLKIWPHNKLFKLLCQPWKGDITFVLPLSTFPVLRSATNFTPKEILKAMKEGQRAVWSKLPAIRAACTIEVAIDAELKSLTLRSRAATRSTLGYPGSKFPSWLNMKCLGIPSSAESLDQLPDNDGDGGLEAIQESYTALGDVGEGTAARLEGGMDAWKDVTALALGLDVIAP